MNQRFNMDLMTVLVFAFLLLSNTIFNIAKNSTLLLLSKYSLVLFLAWVFVTIIWKKKFNRKWFVLFLPYILFNCVYILNTDSFSDTDALMINLNHFIFFLLIYALSHIKWNGHQIKYFSVLFFVSYPILMIFSFILTDSINSNAIGAYSYFLSFFPLLYIIGYSNSVKKLQIFIILTLTITLILTSDTRSILLSAGLSFLTFYVWKLITKSKLLHNLYFFAIAGFGYWITAVYPQIYTWSSYDKLNFWSLKYLDKPLLTGRDRIWDRLTGYIEIKPYFGYGSSVLPGDFTATQLSAHNTYLQIGLQTGIVGIALLTLFFFVIWKSTWNAKNDIKTALAASYFIGIIIYQLFEVNLTQSNFGLGFLQWTVIGFLLSYTMNIDKEKTET